MVLRCSASPPPALWVPRQRLFTDFFLSSEFMTYLLPFPPPVGIRYGVGPVSSLEASEAPGDEGLQLIEYGGGISLTVTASQ